MIAKLTQWLALIFTVAGSIILMIGSPILVAPAYGLFIIGNALWIKVGIDANLKPLIITNILFLIIDIIGFIYINLLQITGF